MNKPACPKHETGGGPCYCPPAPAARILIGCARFDGGADCLVVGQCGNCANAIYEETVAPEPRCCESHHHACDCREHKVAVLIKAALDSATELDGLQAAWAALHPGNEAMLEDAERFRATVERVYDACEALGVQIGTSTDEVPV